MLTFARSGEPRLLMLHFVMDTGWPAQPAPVRSTQVVISWPEAEQKTEWGVYLLIGVDGAISKGVSESSFPVWTHRHGVKHSRRAVRADASASADVADSGDLRVLRCFRAPCGDTTKGNCVWHQAVCSFIKSGIVFFIIAVFLGILIICEMGPPCLNSEICACFDSCTWSDNGTSVTSQP